MGDADRIRSEPAKDSQAKPSELKDQELEALKTAAGFAELEVMAAEEEERDRHIPPDEEDGDQPGDMRWWLTLSVLTLGLIIVAFGLYFVSGRGNPGKSLLGSTGAPGAVSSTQGGAISGGPSSGSQTVPRPRRWLMSIPQTSLTGVKVDDIRYTIVLDSNGESGSVHWLEDPRAKGTFTLKGNRFEAVIMRPDVFPDQSRPDERTEFHMTVQPDGSLSGTVTYDNWRPKHTYAPSTAHATGQPR